MPRASPSMGEFSLIYKEMSTILLLVQSQVTSANCRSPDFISWTLAINLLKPHISVAALHDSLARYPPPQCYTETPSRQKVLKVITDWIKDSCPTQRIMWLNGPARVGKSPIAQTIAEGCQNSRLAASFFFLRNDPDRDIAHRLFTTLTWQLAKSIPETRQYIESALEMEPLLPTKSIDVQFDYLIVKVFQNLLRDKPGLRPEKFLVIIDGLDECATEDQKLFLRLIGNALTCTNIPLRFLICSRPEAPIKETFDMVNMKMVTLAVMLGPGNVRPLLFSRSHLTDPSFR
jgi:hypothetical protein